MNKIIKKIFAIVFFVLIFFGAMFSLPKIFFSPFAFLISPLTSKPFESFGLTLLVSAAFTFVFVLYMMTKVFIIIFNEIRTILIINDVAKELNLKRVSLFTKKREVKGIVNEYEISVKLTNFLECEELFLSELVGTVGEMPLSAIFSFATPYTEVKLTSNKNIANPIVIRRENMFDEIIKNINIQDIETGDQAFDEQFLIKCDDEKALKNVLNKEIRWQIEKIKQKSIIRMVENKICYTQKGGIKDKEYLMFIINLLTKIAKSAKQ